MPVILRDNVNIFSITLLCAKRHAVKKLRITVSVQLMDVLKSVAGIDNSHCLLLMKNMNKYCTNKIFCLTYNYYFRCLLSQIHENRVYSGDDISLKSNKETNCNFIYWAHY